MALYTFVMEYKGGTYISQVRAASPEQALVVWAKSIDESAVWGFGPKAKEQLVSSMRRDEATPLQGLHRAWCASALVRNHLALVNLIETAEA